jgi:hypothetical protein
MNLHQQFLQLAKEKRQITYKLLSLLPEIFASGVYKKYAGSIEGYAFRFAGIPESTVRKSLNLNKLFKNKPKLQAIVKEVGVHKVSAVASLITDENQDIMIEKLRSMSMDSIREMAKEFRGKEKVYRLSVYLTQDQLKLINLVKKQIDPKLSEGELVAELCKQYLNSAKTEQCKVEDSKPAKRYIPAKTKKAVLKQYKNSCAYPGCHKHYSEIHHQVHFSQSKKHENLVPLCKEHHQFMHHNLVQNSEDSPQFWRLQLNKTTNSLDLKYQKMRT